MMRRTLLFLAVVVMAAATAGSAQTPTVSFFSSVESIRVDALVTRNGRPVIGLGLGDFEVRDNGVLQELELVSYEEIPLNVVPVRTPTR